MYWDDSSDDTCKACDVSCTPLGCNTNALDCNTGAGCHATCAGCSGPTATECSACFLGRYLDVNKCNKCPNPCSNCIKSTSIHFNDVLFYIN